MSETKNSKKWVTVGIIILIIFGFIFYATYFKKEKSGIDFIVAKKSNLIQKVNVTGNIEPMYDVGLGFDITGRVYGVNVKVGDRVTTGQYLVKLKSDAIQAQLLQAQANLSGAKAKLAELKIGTRIEKINIQKVKVENAKIILANAEKNVVNKIRDAYSKSDDAVRGRADQLFNNPRSTNPKLNIIISNNQLKTNVETERLAIEKTLVVWEKDLSTLTPDSNLVSFISKSENNLSQIRYFLNNIALIVNSIVSNSSIPQTTIDGYKANTWTARTNINTAITNITSVQDNLRNSQSALVLSNNELALKEAGATKEEISAQEAVVLSAYAEIQNIKVKLTKTILKSPISGIITKVDVKPGEIVQMNGNIVSIMSYNNFKIEANIAEADVTKIIIGDKADVTLDAYGDNFVLKAIVTKIDPAETIIEGVPTYKTTFKLLPSSKKVKAGMTANMDILTNKKDSVIAIPARAVNITNTTSTVRILGENGTVEKKEVKTGFRGYDGRIEILSGIKVGDKVITFMP